MTAAVLAMASPASAAMTTVAQWPMDSVPTMIDASGHGNDGTTTGVSLVTDSGGGFYRFSGSDSHVTVPDSPSLNPGTADLSYTVHVRFTVVPPSSVGDYDLIRKGLAATSGGEWKMEILPNSSTGAANPFCLFKDDAGHSASIRGSQNLADGNWHTITCVKTSATNKLMVDGTWKTSTPSTPLGAISNTAPVVIGQKWGGGDQYTGDMDDVTVQTGSTDTTAPTVTATSPAAGATGVSTSTDVTATFSEDVQNVTTSTFKLKNSATGTAVSATVTYDSATLTATLHPGAALAGGTKYTVTLTTGIKDTSGNALTSTSWNFTTASGGTTSGSGPTVTAKTPADNANSIGLATNVTATFNEKVQNVGSGTFTLAPTAGGAAVAAVYSSNSAGTKWTLNPNVNLIKDTWYTATLTPGITDTSGRALAAPVSWKFLTGPAPKVSAKSPSAGATGVAVTTTVTATFSEPVQNVNDATFTLKSSAGGVTATVTRSGTTNTWILTPAAGLAAGTTYTATLVGGTTGIADLAGNPLKTLSWTFTTA